MMKQHEEGKSLKELLQDCNGLVEELRAKLKLKINDILDLRKQLDLAREETQLAELRYNTLKDAVDKAANDKLNKARGELND